MSIQSVHLICLLNGTVEQWAFFVDFSDRGILFIDESRELNQHSIIIYEPVFLSVFYVIKDLNIEPVSLNFSPS